MNNNIGEFIKLLRTEKKLTQSALGKLLDIDAKTISKWERGVYLPDITMLLPLSKALDVTIEELLDGQRHESVKEIVKDPIVIKEPVIENKVKENKVLNHKSILNIFLVIITITSLSTLLYTTLIKKPKAKEETSQSDVNVYKLESEDENLVIEGYIIEKNSEHLLIIKRLCIKNVDINDDDYKYLEMYLYSPNEKLLLYKNIEKKNIKNENKTIDIISLGNQNLSTTEEINYSKLNMIFLFTSNKIKSYSFSIKLTKEI